MPASIFGWFRRSPGRICAPSPYQKAYSSDRQAQAVLQRTKHSNSLWLNKRNRNEGGGRDLTAVVVYATNYPRLACRPLRLPSPKSKHQARKFLYQLRTIEYNKHPHLTALLSNAELDFRGRGTEMRRAALRRHFITRGLHYPANRHDDRMPGPTLTLPYWKTLLGPPQLLMTIHDAISARLQNRQQKFSADLGMVLGVPDPNAPSTCVGRWDGPRSDQIIRRFGEAKYRTHVCGFQLTKRKEQQQIVSCFCIRLFVFLFFFSGFERRAGLFSWKSRYQTAYLQISTINVCAVVRCSQELCWGAPVLRFSG